MAARTSLLVILLAAALSGAARAAPAELRPAPATPPPPPAAPADSLPTRVEGDRLSQVIENGIPILVIEGVRIQHGAMHLTGKEGRYDRQAGRAVVQGNVKMVDGGTTVTGDHGTYDVASGLARLTGHVRIERQDLEVLAPRATYERAARVARMGGGVTVTDAKRRVEADSVIYWAGEDRALAIGRVRIDEAGEEETTLRGDVAEYRRREGDLQLLERASITFDEGGQPVEVTARDFQFRQEGKEVIAQGNVVVRQKQTEAVADSGFFHRDKDWALLTGSPVARDRNGEVRGDSLELIFHGGELKRLVARGRAQSVYGRPLPEGDREVMHLKGQVLRVELEDGEAREIEVTGGAESVVIPGGRERRESGAVRNEASADRMRVVMATGRPERVILEGGARGMYAYRRARSDTTDAGSADSLEAASAGAATDTTSAAAATDSSFAAVVTDTTSAAPDSLALGSALPDSLFQIVRYQADRIDYLVERDEIILEQRAELFHEDLHLTAGRVVFDSRGRTLLATRDPVLEDGEQTIEGKAMTYAFTPREGAVLKGETIFERGLYSGGRLFRAGDGSLHVQGAAYTTCDVKPPHYHFAGRRMKIYLDDKVITQPLGLFVSRIPILALPFYVFPIKRGRHSGFLLPQVEFGFSQTRGRFVHNAGYYWVINEYADMKSWVDVQEFSPFFIGNTDVRYALRYQLAGDLSTKLTLGQGERQWDIQGSHRHELGRRRTLIANANFLSDREFRREAQGQFAADRLSTQLRSNLSFTKNWSTQSLRMTVDRTQNLQNEIGETEEGVGRVTGNLPTLSYGFSSRPIGRLPDAKGRGGRWPLLASTQYSFSGDYGRSFDTQREPDIYLDRASGGVSLGDRRQLRMLNLGPSLSLNSAWVERREVPDTAGVLRPVGGDFVNGRWNAALNLQTELYGLLAPAIGPFHGFRHTLTPRAALSMTDPFDSEEEGGPPSSSVDLSIANRIETRLAGPKEEEFRRVPDFLIANLSTSYDLSNRTTHRFSSIRGDARLSPGFGHDFEMDYGLTYDPYARRPVRYNTSTRFTFVRAGGRGESGGLEGGGRAGYGNGDEGGLLGRQEDGVSGSARDRGPGVGAAGGTAEETSLEARAAAPAAVPDDLFPQAFTVSGTLTFAGGGAGDKTLQSTLQSSFRLTPKWRVEYQLSYDLVAHEVVRQNYTLLRDLHCWQAQFRRTYETGRWEYYFRVAIKDLPQIFYEKGRDRLGIPRPF